MQKVFATWTTSRATNGLQEASVPWAHSRATKNQEALAPQVTSISDTERDLAPYTVVPSINSVTCSTFIKYFRASSSDVIVLVYIGGRIILRWDKHSIEEFASSLLNGPEKIVFTEKRSIDKYFSDNIEQRLMRMALQWCRNHTWLNAFSMLQMSVRDWLFGQYSPKTTMSRSKAWLEI